ncbi:MAG: hypothetical protein ACTS8S_07615, partial [Giesbergeria sp.]
RHHRALAVDMADLSTVVAFVGAKLVPSAAEVPGFSARLVERLTRGANALVGGTGHIRGNVYRAAEPADLPLRRRVYLHRQRGGLMVQEQWSNAATGAFLFVDLDLNERYYVVAFDGKHDYRAVLADNLVPEVAP